MGVNAPLDRKLRMGLIGGGQGAFIGKVHSIAAVMDNRAALVAGALSSDPARAKASAADYDIKPERAYGSYKEMIAGELKLPAAERVDFVSVATPNHTHFEIARAFAEAGFNVMCDKPMTFDLTQAEELAKVVQKSGVVFALTHNYTGYPLVRQAREMVKAGELGEINAVRASYLQGWLRTRLEQQGQKQAGWRTDPKRSGAAGCWGDIGTHAYNLGRFITGLIPDQISCPRRLRRRRHPLHHRRAGHRDGVADLPRPRERHLDRDRRYQGIAGMAPGGAEQDVDSFQWSAPPFVHPRPQRRLPEADGQGVVPAAERPPGGVPRSVRQRLHGRLRRHGGAGRGPEVRRRRQSVPQRRGRRGRHELHYAVGRQLRGRRGVEIAQAPAVPAVSRTIVPLAAKRRRLRSKRRMWGH